MSSPLESIFSQGPLPVLEKTIRFAEARHRFLVGNIANADTPGYRRQDLSASAFSRELTRAVEDRRERNGIGLEFRDRDGFQAARRTSAGLRILGRDPGVDHGVLRHDGNDVDIEREMVLLQKNSGRLRRSADLLKKYLGMIRAAVTESPR